MLATAAGESRATTLGPKRGSGPPGRVGGAALPSLSAVGVTDRAACLGSVPLRGALGNRVLLDDAGPSTAIAALARGCNRSVG